MLGIEKFHSTQNNEFDNANSHIKPLSGFVVKPQKVHKEKQIKTKMKIEPKTMDG